jgi:hypothetical protein
VSADVIDLAARRAAAQAPEPVAARATRAADALLDMWLEAVRVNRLGPFFASMLPASADPAVPYTSSLDAVAGLEQTLGVAAATFAPGTFDAAQIAWRAAHAVEGATVLTPELPTEAQARCFNILLCLRLRHP